MIEKALITGVRSIDAFCTLGQGQRIGIFASAGVGKSTLLAMMARRAAADVIVVALVGERGREVREFVEDTLGFEGMERSIVVVATSDESSIVRQTAPFTATAIAEHFSEQGKNVLLIVDSLTRTARALRETSLAAGELPVRHGYTSSVYIQLPKLLERAGRSGNGSITALYTVLTNEEDDIDPLADEIKSLLDGHLVLRRELAARGVLPALDVTASVSRLFTRLHDSNYVQTAYTGSSRRERSCSSAALRMQSSRRYWGERKISSTFYGKG
jgi:type III secretion protein N (ATPase)